MIKRHLQVGVLLLVFGLILAACQSSSIDSKLQNKFADALNLAVAELSLLYGDIAPSTDLDWSSEVTDAENLPEEFSSQLNFQSDNWTAQVSLPTDNPEESIFRVRIENDNTGFVWENWVQNGVGIQTPTKIDYSTRNNILFHLKDTHQQNPPAYLWMEEILTRSPQSLKSEYRFINESWVITINSQKGFDEKVFYWATAVENETGFEWVGRVNANGKVEEGPEKVLTTMDVVIQLISISYPDSAPSGIIQWGREEIPEGTSEDSESHRYVSDNWMITVSFNPDLLDSHYYVSAINSESGFIWIGELDANWNLIDYVVSL